jgi:oligopeptide transport system substrate-binding protein
MVARYMRLPRLTRVGGIALAIVLVAVAVLRWHPTLAADRPLRYLGGALGSLDPARINDAGDVQLLLQLYAGLTRLDEEGNVYPSLASSWDVSPDGMTYTFHLRANLHFSNGSVLDASDVRRSWLRLLDPQVHASAPDVLDLITGATQRLGGGSESAVGVTVPDPRTLLVHLTHPAGYFPAITATPTTFVVPRSAAPSGEWQSVDRFVGSGPYAADRMDGTNLVLQANPEYAGTAPPISQVEWVTDVTGDPVTAYSDGKLDLVQIAPSDATWIGFDAILGRGLHQAAALSLEYLGFDTTRPPFNDVRVRRAFSLALDRTRLVELSAGEAARPANSVVPPAIQPAGFPADAAANVTEAKRLLDEAGFSNRSKLGTIVVDGSGLDVTPIVATWRQQLGVAIEVETMQFDDYLAALDAGRTPQVFTINWITDYPSPHALYGLLLSPQARSNYGHWNDPHFVELLDAAAAASGEAAQARAYASVEAEVDAQVPIIPWSYDESSWLVRPGLRGLGTLTIGLLDFGLVSWE